MLFGHASDYIFTWHVNRFSAKMFMMRNYGENWLAEIICEQYH